MNEAAKHKGHFSERLPGHNPDRDLWVGIAGGLESGLPKSLTEDLPIHKPAKSLWGSIARSLPVPWYSFRSIYFRSALGVLLIMLLIFLIPDFTGENLEIQTTLNKTIVENPGASEDVVSVKANQPRTFKLSETLTEIEEPAEKHNNKAATKIEIISGETAKQENTPVLVNPYLGVDGEAEKPFDVIIEGEQVAQNTEAVDFDYEAQSISSNLIKNEDKELPKSSSKLLKANPLTIHNSRVPKAFSGSGNQYRSYRKDINYEAGIFAQPSFIHNISTINDNWYLSPGLGFSLAMVNKKFILETGMSYMQMEFEDKVEIDYYAFVFMGTVINTESEWEEYVNDQGDTLLRQIYTVQLIDVYDSAFVEEEKNDVVKLSGVTIPLTVGYRFSDNGRFFYDLKAGLDMMIITGRVIPGNPTPVDSIRVLDVKNSLADKYSVRWKYHISLGVGFRATERMAIYAEPTLWWYPEGIRNKETNTIKNPFEAGIRIGLRWGF